MSEAAREARRKRRAQERARGRAVRPAPRSCGGCTACCTALAVAELGKAQGEACKHLVPLGTPGVSASGGCSIYARRPAPCRDFRCVWLQGLLQEKHRPDRTGVVISSAGPDSPFERQTGIRPVTAFEARQGAFESPEGAALLALLAEGVLVVLVRGDGTRKAMGPPPLVLAFQRFLAVAGAA